MARGLILDMRDGRIDIRWGVSTLFTTEPLSISLARYSVLTDFTGYREDFGSSQLSIRGL